MSQNRRKRLLFTLPIAKVDKDTSEKQKDAKKVFLPDCQEPPWQCDKTVEGCLIEEREWSCLCNTLPGESPNEGRKRLSRVF
jgi:hypothetical protein